jgi:hypothetical protein
MIYEFQKRPTLPIQGGFFYIVESNQTFYETIAFDDSAVFYIQRIWPDRDIKRTLFFVVFKLSLGEAGESDFI